MREDFFFFFFVHTFLFRVLNPKNGPRSLSTSLSLFSVCPAPLVVLHFLVTVVFFIIIGNEKTLLRRERERDKEREI